MGGIGTVNRYTYDIIGSQNIENIPALHKRFESHRNNQDFIKFQVLAALAAQSINISVGFCQGFSAVLLPQYTLEYPLISYEQTSWIGEFFETKP